MEGRHPDMHLFAWTPLTLGNLVRIKGFGNIEAKLLPDSAGGRLGSLFAEGSSMRRRLSYFKALRSGRFHTCVTARKPVS